MTLSGRRLARAASILGLSITALLALRLASVQATRDATGLIWGLAFGLTYMAPFLLASTALWVRDVPRRGTVCIGAGIAALLLMFTSLAGVALVLFVPAIHLIVGGVMLFEEEPSAVHGPTTTFIFGPIGAVVATFAALFARADLSLGLLVASLALWSVLVGRVLILGRRIRGSVEVRM
jgi:hypothetical protein